MHNSTHRSFSPTHPRGPSGPRTVAGYTLIELLIVVAIIAILSTIAYNSYTSSVVKSRRNAAAACTLEAATLLERMYTTALTYPTAANFNNAATTPAFGAMTCRTDLANFYTLTMSAGTANSYTLTATPLGQQLAKDTYCGTLSVNNRGTKGETGTATSATECW